MNFNANEQHAEPALPGFNEKVSISPQEAREAAEALVRQEVISERLQGREILFKRWQVNNASYWDYRVRLKAAELNGTTAAVQAADAYLTEKRNARQWREHSGNSVVSPDGIVMTKRQARLLGWEG